MSSIDQQFVEYVVKSLVSKPDKIMVVRRIDEKGVLLELTVDPEDLGRVIGKHGATAQSIRTLLRALGTKNDARYNLKIVDNGENRRSDEFSSNERYSKPENSNESQSPQEDVKSEEPKADNEIADEPKVEESVDRFKQTRDELAEFDDLDV